VRRGVRFGRVLALALIGMLAVASAAVPAAPPAAHRESIEGFAKDAWSTSAGLPHNAVHAITQTGDGYLWFATWEGVARYNGVGFTTFSRMSTPALPDSAIATIAADRFGNLWTGDTRGNLGRRDPAGRWRFWGRAQGMPRAAINRMAVDHAGRVWVGFDRLGIGRLDPDGRFTVLRGPAGKPITVLRIAIDAKGRPWLGTLDGAYRADRDGRLRAMSAELGLPPGQAMPFRDKAGYIWLTAGSSLYRVEGGQAVVVFRQPDGKRFSDFLHATNGDLWLGTENDGLLRVKGTRVDHFSTRNGLPEGRITALFEDREHSIWVGANGGLFRLRKALFANLRAEDGLSGNYVRALAETRDGSLWVGSSKGLDVVPPSGVPRPVPLGPAANRVSVMSLSAGPDDLLTIGTFGDGVLQARGGRVVRRITQAQGLPANHVRAFAQARGGGVWAGTQRGVALIDPAGHVRLPRTHDLPAEIVYSLSETPEGLWVGTVSGAWLWNHSGVHRIDIMGAGQANSVFGFFHDPEKGDTWISTDRGLFRHRRDGQLDHIGIERGMPVDGLFQMTVGRGGSAWIGSNKGIVHVCFKALRLAADGRPPRIAPDLFTALDGLASAQSNGASGPTTLLRRDGTIWIATAEGVAFVDPRRLAHFRFMSPPAVAIESVEADGQPMTAGPDGAYVLPAGTHRLTIAYAGLSYLLPQGIRYRTQMDGFDTGWVDRESQRTAEFTTLPPGTYTFRVQAAQARGDWGPDKTITVRLEPFLWQRSSFQLACAALVILALWCLHRWRTLALARRERQLARLVDARTAELRQQSHVLEEVAQEREQLLDRLRGQADALEQLANEDPLTGVANRRRFNDMLSHVATVSAQDGRHWSLAIVDIDHFKQVNDRHSHVVGDLALCAVAEVLRHAAPADHLVARLGGEEFALLMPDTDAVQAARIGERIRTAVQQRDYRGIAPDLAITISIGVATCAMRGVDAATIFQAADAALYRAKAWGRNRVVAD
jgi:diguanylate cyclase (GGDEF)-like protein